MVFSGEQRSEGLGSPRVLGQQPFCAMERKHLAVCSLNVSTSLYCPLFFQLTWRVFLQRLIQSVPKFLASSTQRQVFPNSHPPPQVLLPTLQQFILFSIPILGATEPPDRFRLPPHFIPFPPEHCILFESSSLASRSIREQSDQYRTQYVVVNVHRAE